MGWMKRLLLVLPFVIAGVLNVLMVNADRFHLRREHIAGYGFLFCTPWAWLLDRGWFGHVHSRWMMMLVGYSVILWIPAALYSCCIWGLFAGFRLITARRS
jgi:hypothetical protein